MQLPLTLAGAGLKDLTLGGDLPPEEVIACTSISDIYNKSFMQLILREQNDTLFELETCYLTCSIVARTGTFSGQCLQHCVSLLKSRERIFTMEKNPPSNAVVPL